jgi:hypothetical protein
MPSMSGGDLSETETKTRRGSKEEGGVLVERRKSLGK